MRCVDTKKFLHLTLLLALAASFCLQGCGNTQVKGPEEKQKYVLPDSLVSTISIDTVKKCQLVNAITLTGQVDFNRIM